MAALRKHACPCTPTRTRQARRGEGVGDENTESRRLTQQSAASVTGMKGCSVCLQGGVADQITADQAPRCCLALSDRS